MSLNGGKFPHRMVLNSGLCLMCSRWFLRVRRETRACVTQLLRSCSVPLDVLNDRRSESHWPSPRSPTFRVLTSIILLEKILTLRYFHKTQDFHVKGFVLEEILKAFKK